MMILAILIAKVVSIIFAYLLNLSSLCGTAYFYIASVDLNREVFVPGYYRFCVMVANTLVILISMVSTLVIPFLNEIPFLAHHLGQDATYSSWLRMTFRALIALFYACFTMLLLFMTCFVASKKNLNSAFRRPGKYDYLLTAAIVITSLICGFPYFFSPLPFPVVHGDLSMALSHKGFIIAHLTLLMLNVSCYIRFYLAVSRKKKVEMISITLSMFSAILSMIIYRVAIIRDHAFFIGSSVIVFPCVHSFFSFCVVYSKTIFFYHIHERLNKSRLFKWLGRYGPVSESKVYVIGDSGPSAYPKVMFDQDRKSVCVLY